jgi:hypothetical protein
MLRLSFVIFYAGDQKFFVSIFTPLLFKVHVLIYCQIKLSQYLKIDRIYVNIPTLSH